MELRTVVTTVALILVLTGGSLVAQDCLEPVVRWPYGVSKSVAAEGDLAHIFGGFPGGLHIYDVTIPQTPVWQGSATIRSKYREKLAAIDDHILVTTYLRGLTVVETVNPASPAPVSTLDAPGRSSDAAYSDGVLFIALEDRGLRMVDVSDPSHPVELGYSQVVPEVFGVAVRGDIAYVLGYSSLGLVVVDVSDPTALAILGNAPGVGGQGSPSPATTPTS